MKMAKDIGRIQSRPVFGCIKSVFGWSKVGVQMSWCWVFRLQRAADVQRIGVRR